MCRGATLRIPKSGATHSALEPLSDFSIIFRLRLIDRKGVSSSIAYAALLCTRHSVRQVYPHMRDRGGTADPET
jgi:hypothetical protein